MGLFSSKKKQTIGHKYYIGMHMIAGHGHLDACEKIRVGEKDVWACSDSVKDSFTDLITALSADAQAWLAQGFTASSTYTLTSVEIRPYCNNETYHPGIVTVSIRETDGNGHPTGADLCRGYIEEDDIIKAPGTLSSVPWLKVQMDTPVKLSASTVYAICIRPTEGSNYDGIMVCSGYDYTGGIPSYSQDDGKTWQDQPSGSDVLFKINQASGTPPNGSIYVNKPNIFGGVQKEGGVQGTVDFMFGDSTQSQNSYLVGRLGSDIPAFRGLFSAILRRVYIGTSGYIKPWSFFLKRVTKQVSGADQWYKEKAVIRPREESGDDLNAIHIIRECLIDSEWGMGEPESDIDADSFYEAANTLYDEGFGLSLTWDQSSSIEQFIDEILYCIAGVLYQDLQTGKWKIVLTRDGAFSSPYNYVNTNDNNYGTIAGDNGQFGQTFTTSKNYSAKSAKIKIYKLSTGGAVYLNVELQEVDSNGHPNGVILAKGMINDSSIPEDIGEWVECVFDKPCDLTVNTKYALVIYCQEPESLQGICWRVNTYSPYREGTYEYSSDAGQTWSTVYTNDFMFEIYAGGDVETFSEGAITEIEDFNRPTYGEITDVVTVKWWDKLANKNRPATARDIALIEKQGGAIIERVIDFSGICNASLANTVAERELKLYSSMLCDFRLKCTRKMAHIKPNDIFKISWPDLDISQMTVRAININYGSLHKNEVIIDCVEDVFSVAETVYGDAPDTLWEDPITDPEDATNVRIVEAPYWSLVNDIIESESLVNSLDNEAGFITVVAEKPSSDSFDYNLLVRFAAGYDFVDVSEASTDWTPTGVITNGIAQSATEEYVDLSSEFDLDLVEEGTYALIDEEIIGILTVDTDNSRVEIARGLLDTTPKAHSAGARIYFMGLHYAEVKTEYTDGNTPSVKLLTRTAKGTLDEDDATIFTADALDSRMIRPYPPGNLKINGERFPTYVSSGANGNKITLTWNHRDRTNITQLQSLVKHDEAVNYGPEAGATYTIKIYDEDDILCRTFSGITGTSQEYTETQEIADCGALQDRLRFEIYAVRDGFNSWQNGYDITVKRSLRGTISAQSNVSGEMIAYFDGRYSINAVSSVTGSLSSIFLLDGSISEVSNVSGSLKVPPLLKGTIDATSGISGYLFIENVLQDHYNIIDDGASEPYFINVYGDRWEGQTFTASNSYRISSAKIRLYAVSDLTGKTITVSIRATSSGLPTGEDLCSGTIPGSAIGIGSGNLAWHEATFDSGPILTKDEVYAVCIRIDETSQLLKTTADVDNYSGGSRVYSNDGGSVWAAGTSFDVLFETYGN